MPSASVSGVAVPSGDLPDWKLQFADDFSGTKLTAGWGTPYDTQYTPTDEIPSTPGGAWRPSHVIVADGKLTLKTYFDTAVGKWTSGGVMNTVGGKTTYGKYEVRFRMDKANGVKYAFLLWPQSNIWPRDGEIDFAEDGGGQRTSTTGTLIYTNGDALTGTQKIQRSINADFSQWHTAGVEWQPGSVSYTLDGVVWATVLSNEVPTGPMNLALQAEAGPTCNQWTCLDATTPAVTNTEIDWVAVYVRK